MTRSVQSISVCLVRTNLYAPPSALAMFKDVRRQGADARSGFLRHASFLDLRSLSHPGQNQSLCTIRYFLKHVDVLSLSTFRKFGGMRLALRRLPLSLALDHHTVVSQPTAKTIHFFTTESAAC